MSKNYQELSGISGNQMELPWEAQGRGFKSHPFRSTNPAQCHPPVTAEPNLDSSPYQLVCTQCQCEFESDNGFDRICDPCNHDNYEQERGVGEYIFDN